MSKSPLFDNPFTVQSPEGLDAKTVQKLFVDVFTDFRKIPSQGHTLIQGARGCGKSMMFRYLQPDCQCLLKNCYLDEIDHFAIYVPIKNTELNLTELLRLKNKHADFILNEHFLCVVVALKTFESLLELDSVRQNQKSLREINKFLDVTIINLLRSSGFSEEINFNKIKTIFSGFNQIFELIKGIHIDLLNYLRRLSFRSAPLSYEGPLFSYLSFLLPMLKELSSLSFMPDEPIFLLLDDTDNLNETQTMVVNSWVSTRTSANVSIKISTQLKKYKTMRTISSTTIDTPHDYQEVNISDIYTSSRDLYPSRIKKIVENRFSIANIDYSADAFFPVDEKQEGAIKKLAEKIRKEWSTKVNGHKGYRPSDDSYRYARPNYIKGLGGTKKSRSTYKYAGFFQLVHISSGNVRFFLDSAALMFDEEKKRNAQKVIKYIRTGIQDKVVREMANRFLESEFDKMSKDACITGDHLDKISKLQNLIKSMGATFHEILVSDLSERRVFSIALTNIPDQEIHDVLTLGVQYGYFHESTIGTKDGTGRTRLYILNRRLSPYFNLDPTSFAGYLFVTNAALKLAMHQCKKLRKLKEKEENLRQLKLFRNI